MTGHLYKVTVEQLEDRKGNPVEASPLCFEARCHDDLFTVVEKLQEKMPLNEADTQAFAVGLKLFSEVMMKNRDNPLFKSFKPAFTEFMMALKKG
ncbi:DUF3861 domain-containing protein [Ferrimonas balearica]|uniref:DUF3861 domain-containing protein n=1 Tax=Ferrimonas balearica TaxID=44012 RepID=UPI001F298120|nr:DUF3861 domain-containing protein [Ferrimonas balearica]MBY6094902.1 DUF3861 domain-containing protein [Ferrimonas balearica]